MRAIDRPLGFFFALVTAFSLAACGAPQGAAELPDACSLISIDEVKNIVQEPVRNAVPVKAGVGEQSACRFVMPARTDLGTLYLFLLPARTAEEVATDWQARYAGHPFSSMPGSKGSMAWFETDNQTVPPTLIAAFQEATLVIAGCRQANAQSLAYQIMLNQGWEAAQSE